MIAIISDIHANIEAFEVVQSDMEAKGITDVLCLGDIIGYGPNPREAIKMARGSRFSLLGNHEEAVLFEPVDFNANARRIIDWTRDQLNSPTDREENDLLWDYLRHLKTDVTEGDYLFVHGSPRQPTRDYVLPFEIVDVEKMTEVFEGFQQFCLAGHTHLPGVFSENGRKFTYARELKNEFVLDPREKVLINVGSVGQPRDGDNRACYVTIDGDVLRWHRLPYDFQTTIAKIKKTPELSERLSERLRDGR